MAMKNKLQVTAGSPMYSPVQFFLRVPYNEQLLPTNKKVDQIRDTTSPPPATTITKGAAKVTMLANNREKYLKDLVTLNIFPMSDS
jgi:hypothetical protein